MKSVISAGEIKEIEKRFVIEDGELFYTGRKPKNTREAFAISIAKWTILRKEAKKGNCLIDGDTSTCGLCMKFYNDNTAFGLNCRLCPVHKQTGYTECHGTPFYDYRGSFTEEDGLIAAEAELKFLVQLANKTLK